MGFRRERIPKIPVCRFPGSSIPRFLNSPILQLNKNARRKQIALPGLIAGRKAKNTGNCLGAPVFRDKIGIFVPTEAKIFDV